MLKSEQKLINKINQNRINLKEQEKIKIKIKEKNKKTNIRRENTN